jgi:hypothetical protein
MSIPQVISNFTNVVNHIEDQNELKTYFDAPTIVAKGNKRQSTTIIRTNKPQIDNKNIATPSTVRVKRKLKKTTESHDLSIVFLANDLFRNSKPLPEAAILAFDDVLKASALTIPTLPNRL